MRACLFRCGVLFLVVLTGCDGLLEDYSGTLCNPDGGCIEGYHCVAETGRCELGTVDAGVCASVNTCVSSDGCCPEGCYANSDNDCAPVCGNLQLEPGEACDDGNTSNEDDCPSTCKPNICGDAFVDRQAPRVEACDDGNTVNEVACAYGTRTCTTCASTCTEVLDLKGPYCGDGTQNGPETCDDGNGSNEDNCLTTCVLATCGDGYRHMTNEACDDGNRVSETACPYGTQSCTRCDDTCSALLSLKGPYCGDGSMSDGESCDDGNTTDETMCPYGTASCTTCNSTCSATRPLTGPYCGDRVINGSEVCDDGNTEACGTCNNTCLASQLSAASGSLTYEAGSTSSSLNDRETFMLSDGINPPVTFEFDKNGSYDSARVPVNVANISGYPLAAGQVATAIADAINNSPFPLNIAAVTNANVVQLTNNQAGAFGNQAITESVGTSRFTVTGMSSGGGFDCPSGISCTRNEDCDPTLQCLPDNTCGTP